MLNKIWTAINTCLINLVNNYSSSPFFNFLFMYYLSNGFSATTVKCFKALSVELTYKKKLTCLCKTGFINYCVKETFQDISPIITLL